MYMYIYIKDVQGPERNGNHARMLERNCLMRNGPRISWDRNAQERNGYWRGPERTGTERNGAAMVLALS